MKKVLQALALAAAFCTASAGAHVYSKDGIAKLEQIGNRDNFVETPMYTGVKDPALRARLNSNIHDGARKIAEAARRGADSDAIIALMKTSIWQISSDDLDTEDAEHYASAYEQMLDALEIESSNGVLNDWMYGFLE